MSSDRKTGAASATSRNKTAVPMISANTGGGSGRRNITNAATAHAVPCSKATITKAGTSRLNWAATPPVPPASNKQARSDSNFEREVSTHKLFFIRVHGCEDQLAKAIAIADRPRTERIRLDRYTLPGACRGATCDRRGWAYSRRRSIPPFLTASFSRKAAVRGAR